jgi:hypothetical protein
MYNKYRGTLMKENIETITPEFCEGKTPVFFPRPRESKQIQEKLFGWGWVGPTAEALT